MPNQSLFNHNPTRGLQEGAAWTAISVPSADPPRHIVTIVGSGVTFAADGPRLGKDAQEQDDRDPFGSFVS